MSVVQGLMEVVKGDNEEMHKTLSEVIAMVEGQITLQENVWRREVYEVILWATNEIGVGKQ